MKQHGGVGLLLSMLGCIYSGTGNAFPTGAPPGYTGAVGEADCSHCHSGELDGIPPEFELQGLDQEVTAGARRVLTLLLSHPDMQVAGVQISVRLDGSSIKHIDHLHSTGLKPVLNDGIVYLNHTAPIPAKAGQVTVTIEWNVPQVPGGAVINVAVVAGNDDESPLGDSVAIIEQHIRILPD